MILYNAFVIGACSSMSSAYKLQVWMDGYRFMIVSNVIRYIEKIMEERIDP